MPLYPLIGLALLGLALSLAPFLYSAPRPASGAGRVILKIPVIGWAGAIVWEFVAAAVGWNIRVDLLLIWPLLLLSSLAAAIVWIATAIRRREKK